MRINLSDMLFAVVNFAIMAFILTKLLYKPVLKILDKRQAQLEAMQTQSEEALHQAKENLQSAQNEIKSARLEAKSILEQAKNEGKTQQSRLVEEASERAKSMLIQTKTEIEREQEKARRLMQKEVVMLSTEMTRHLMEQEVDLGAASDKFIEQLDSDEARNALKSGSINDSDEAQVYYAIALTESQKKALAQKLSQIAHKSVKLKLIHKPAVLGGLTVQLGDCLLDGSLANKLTKLQNEIMQS